ncbi:MAG: hypothetical protein M3R55_14975 [Acidobacteriota bacterium]|nr:hypothetical protein [Acidobacteriota bacterium]
MANVESDSNPSKGAGNQKGHEPEQGNKREPGSPQQANYGAHKDKGEKGGGGSKN